MTVPRRTGQIARLLCIGLFTATTLNVAAQPQTQDKPRLTNRLIVKYRNGAGLASLNDGARLAGIAVKERRYNRAGAEVWKMARSMTPTEAAQAAANVARKDANVLYAEPDLIMAPNMVLNDARASEQWDLYDNTVGLRAPAAWDQTNGAGVTVAVLDTGYLPHADLAANIVGGYDFISDTTMSNDGDARDANALDTGDGPLAGECGGGYPSQDQSSSWHGTHVAGTVAAVGNNATGVAGVAWGAKVLPVRVLGKCGGYTSDIADAIVWAAGGTVSGVPANSNPAKVISLSLGGGGACSRTFQTAIDTARGLGAAVVIAAGNSNTDVSSASPANCNGVIAVAATGRTGARAYYSNYGAQVDIAAPGGDMSTGQAGGILSTLNSGTRAPGADTYAYYQGTSMATPHVSGVAALMLAVNPNLTPDALEAALKSSARTFPGTCDQCGAGLLDANAAVVVAAGGTPPAPTPTPPTPTPPPGSVITTETEPNNSIAHANAITASTAIVARMGSNSDTDYYSVSLPARGRMEVTLTMASARADYDLLVLSPDGRVIAQSIKGAGRIDRVSLQNRGNSAAPLLVRVLYYSGPSGETTGAYGLKVGFGR